MLLIILDVFGLRMGTDIWGLHSSVMVHKFVES